MAAGRAYLLVVPILLFYQKITKGEVLTPPYFNLAQERRIYASSTCGEEGQELYCRLTGASSENGFADPYREIIQGQYCDVCDPSIREHRHPPEYAIDGTERWWQSPPLSRGMEYNRVNLTIDLGQEFHVAYVFIKMANSPRPGVWALERSTDFGQSWRAWQYFADTPSDCMKFFGVPADQEIYSDDAVICSTEFSKIVPLENGEIVVSLINNRPNAQNFTYANQLQQWTKATNVRLKLLRTKTLLGHLMAVARQDPTVTRRYFYSIKDISIGGRCVCNGHANTCARSDSSNPNLLVCACQHNTCGNQCDSCCPGFVQKKWKPARADKIFMCEPCQCYGHSTECVYDEEVDRLGLSVDTYGNYEGGGVCQNCQHNTYGVNCDKCVAGYYRPYGVTKNDTNVCRPCQCDLNVSTGECEEGSGRCLCRIEYAGLNCDRCAPGYEGYPTCVPCQCHMNGTEGAVCSLDGLPCPCKENYVGNRCDMCASGYYNFPECTPCQCDTINGGSTDNNCDVETGQCTCQSNFASKECNQCAHGYYNYPACTVCDCDPSGTSEEICDKQTGQCLCKESFQYPRCDRCAPGYYNYPTCQECQCAEPGSIEKVCRADGQCPCRANFGGRTCSRCHPGFFRYPDCSPCNCDRYGSFGETCEQLTGQCECRATFDGLSCSKCKEGFYNYPMCEECNCNPAGAKQIPGYPLGGCGEVIKGQLCECKERVMGRICDQCMPGYYNLDRNNPLGCDECSCYAPGTVAGLNMCHSGTGQCTCKLDVVGRRCDTCASGFFGLSEANPFGCTECDCDSGGSINLRCEQRTGQCPCKPRVGGRRCDIPERNHFYPTLQQFKYEIEDGRTPEGSRIRYGFDETYFPKFSWRGYAILTAIQPEVEMDIEIKKPSLYRLIFRYVNVNDKVLRGQVMLKPQNPTDVTQNSEVFFQVATDPMFVTVGSGRDYEFVLNPGRWKVSISSPDILLLDYMVLVPDAYYEATVLQEKVTRPCSIPGDQGPCVVYDYPNLEKFPSVIGGNGFVIDRNGSRIPTQVFPNQIILDELGIPTLAQLDNSQRELHLNLTVPRPGDYVLVFNYFALSNRTQELDVIANVDGQTTTGTVLLYSCKYSVLCRQVMKNIDDMPSVITVDDVVQIQVTGDKNIDVAIGSVVAIPYDEWSLGYIRPSIICIRINGICVTSGYTIPSSGVRLDFEDPPNDNLIATTLPNYITETGLIELNNTNRIVELRGNIRNPGQYVFFVHFYMPSEAGADLPVTLHTDGFPPITGTFKPRFCPTISGCRSQIVFDGTVRNVISLQPGNFTILFNNTMGRNVLLDYLMVVPIQQFSPSDLNLQRIDNSAKFLQWCVGPGFVLVNDTEFCRSGVYTITTDFNNGGLACGCDTDGSLSFECSNFGGQCQCRDNVIGQKCTQCREGYYGFPRCKPCNNCPYGMCNPRSGECMCPPRVTGERCNTCVPATYGFDPLVGCTDCKCNAEGVLNENMNCDQTTGQCTCKDNVGGRKCDYCLAGFYSFPYCAECSNCDSKGTQEQICDVSSGVCLCKENVAAPDCSRCESGSFYLDPMNPKGCTRCFCFGTTTRCDSSVFVWAQHQDMLGWDVTNTAEGALRESQTIIAVLDSDTKITDPNQAMYWIASDSYLGDQVKSYGGKLQFKVYYVTPRGNETRLPSGPDVILKGGNMTLHHRYSNTPEATATTPVEIRLNEYNFVRAEDGLGVSRETFMMVLVDITAIHIRANYFTPTTEVRLMDVQLDQAVERQEEETTDDGGNGGFFGGFFFGGSEQTTPAPAPLARSVEQCQCPMGYVGSSCQDCAPGYYRSSKTPYLGVCIPCNCHGHSDTCDKETGECQNCRDNTMGKQCGECLPGYYGDPMTGGCQICSCPMPIESNNFASGCNVYEGTVYSCDCLPGYTGSRCERCAPGYYGDPTVEGEVCQPCQCSGNIDMSDPEACSLSTGECLKCLNHTMGPACAYCQDWYHGDAVNLKNCQACSCDQCGSSSCDRNTGSCQCQPNVEGPDCDRCKADTYGFDSCAGCQDCNCAAASVSSQCDAVTGQCTCRPGTEGRYCDQCSEGYWNYTAAGCQACECEEDGAITCDRVTGRCQCLPGVTGDRCDRCLPRYILVANKGCQACDNCIHILLDDVEALQRNISGLSTTLESVSVGMTANNRLEEINQAAINLRPEVDALLAGPQDISLDPLSMELTAIQALADNGKLKSDRLITQGQFLTEETEQLVRDADDIEAKTAQVKRETDDVVQYAQNILRQIYEGIKVTNIETIIKDSMRILEVINSANFTGNAEECNTEEDLARELLAKMRFLFASGQRQSNDTAQVLKEIKDISMRLYDLQSKAQNSDREADAAEELIKELNQKTLSLLQIRLGGIEMSEKDTMMLHSMSDRLLADARDALNKSVDEANEAELRASQIDNAVVSMRDFVGNLSNGLEEAIIKVNESQEHAQALSDQADFLENIYTDTRETSANALSAASAFKEIVDAIDDANNASSTALDAANEALGKSNGVGESSENSKNISIALLESARALYDTTEVALAGRLQDAKLSTDDVEVMNDRLSNEINDLNIQIQEFSRRQFGNRTRDASNQATGAGQRALNAQEKVGTILSKLPEDKNKIDRLANTVAKTDKSIKDARSQGDFVKNNLPQVITQIDLLGTRNKSVQALQRGVSVNLTLLKERIELARDAANRIRVGLEFVGNTTATLRNPANIDSAGSYSTLSMYVQTRQKRAVLAYVGADMMPNRVTPDYMSLELRDGFPVLRYNLGSGAAEIVSTRDVSDGNWYLIKAKRIGKSGELVVEGDRDKGLSPVTSTGESSGTFTVLELNPQTTKFYVGGVPSDVRLPNEVESSFYEGVMEEVMFDGKPLGLWNFVDGENNFKGAIERDVMQSVISNGFRFNGKGYVKLSVSKVNFKPRTESSLILHFKTYVDTGLLFYMGKTPDFMSLELKKGRVLFQYDLGGNRRAELITNRTFNDGEWHKIQAQRQNQFGVLTVDDGEDIRGQSPGSMKELSFTDDMFIGGYNRIFLPMSNVTSRGFDGCIRDLQFNINKWDLNKNEVAKGVVRGCPEQILRTATFDKDGGYIAKAMTASVGTNFDVTFRIKTKSDASMILYTSNNDQTSGFSVAIVGGRLIVTSDPGGDPTVLESTVNTYNDGNWHYVSIMKMGAKLMMNIDDQEMLNKTGRSGTAVLTERPLYIGGTDFTMSDSLVSSTARFSGCVSDFTINGVFLNFATVPRQNVRGVSFSECPIEDSETPVSRTTVRPTFPPESEEKSTTAPVPVEEKCRLSQNVDVGSVTPGEVEGIKFGDTLTSRYQYNNWKSLRVKFTISLEFKTTSSGGVILYAVGRRKIDFFALTMKEGRLVFSFDCGSRALNLETDQTYNDGKWHTVDFGRVQKTGKISVDGETAKEGTSPGSTQALNVGRPYFLGGITPQLQAHDKVKGHLQGVLGSFDGCIRNMKINDESFGEPVQEQKVSQCVANLERGTFFNDQGGYITLYDKYYVGLDFAFNLDIRPRNLSGVILAVHSSNSSDDFILLQLVDGKVIATADNGKGEVTTTYIPRQENALCDGEWHRISVNKAKNLLLLTVDGMNAPAGTGTRGSSEINSNDPLYLGGVPDFNRRGILVDRNFSGCMRNFEIRRGKDESYQPKYFAGAKDITGDITLNKCPLN
ncbi:laminin subunit alpha-like [Saccostrea echinata]|uniref:laminin subunit alpha-like n=1 Tax=Saccostrea echinata TaxID=191078 RepID=UPI002A7FEE04|nr:laminin subunit alpha-like [Saccostrea echinata]